MAGTKRTKYDDEALDVIEARLKDALRIIVQTRNGSSMAEAIRKENLNMHNVRSLFGTALSMKVNDVPGELSVKSLDDMMYTPVETLYKDIFGWSDSEWLKCPMRIPEDAEETVKTIMKDLTEREQLCINLYYFEEFTLEEVGKRLNVTRDRIRQIIAKGIRKLRNPHRSNILAVGMDEYNRIHEEVRRIRDETREKYLEQFKQEEEKKYDNNEDFLEVSIEELELSVRAYNCLKRGGCDTIKDVFLKDEDDFMRIRNLGRKSKEEVQQKVEDYLRFHGLNSSTMVALKEKLRGEKLEHGLWGLWGGIQ